MPASTTLGPMTYSRLETSLMNTKASTLDNEFYPNQASARGGIGVLLSTGAARGSLMRLPAAAKASKSWQAPESPPLGSRPISMASSRPPVVTSINPEASHEIRSLADKAAVSVIVGAGAGLPPEARHDWERGVAHPHNFVSTARQTRIDDVRPASKWSGISFYENSPREIKRHLDIMGIVDNNHFQGKLYERTSEKVRHLTWALQQREVFRRQRQEVAARYQRAGIPPRRQYHSLPNSRGSLRSPGSADMAAEAGWDPSSMRNEMMGDSQMSARSTGVKSMGTVGSDSAWAAYFPPGQKLTHSVSIPLPKPTYTQVYKKMASEKEELAVTSAQKLLKRAEESAHRRQEDEKKEDMASIDIFDQELRATKRMEDIDDF